MKTIALSIAASITVLAAQAPAAVFTDWTTINTQTHVAEGILDGISTTLSGDGLNWGVADGSWTGFDRAVFTPSLPSSDLVYIEAWSGATTYTITFGGPVRDPILHIASLASALTFSTTNITKLSGDPDLTVSSNTVTGILSEPPGGYTDASGSLRLNGVFTTITFTAVILPTVASPPDGIYVQVGGVSDAPRMSIRVSEVEVCWTSVTNASYRVEYRSALTTNAWVTLRECVPSVDTETCIYDKVLRGQPQRFYRVAVTNCVPGP